MSDAAPKSHPFPNTWWQTIRRQSWLCYWVIAAEIPAVLTWGVAEHAVTPLVIANIVLAIGAASYGGGSTLVDAIKAWRGNQ